MFSPRNLRDDILNVRLNFLSEVINRVFCVCVCSHQVRLLGDSVISLPPSSQKQNLEACKGGSTYLLASSECVLRVPCGLKAEAFRSCVCWLGF